MPETFLPMGAWFERRNEPVVAAVEVHESVDVAVVPVPDDVAVDDVDEAIGEARRFRASLADALALCVEEVLRDIASDVLARELLLAPCDLQAIVARAVERYGEEPVRIRVHSSDAYELTQTTVTVVHDDTLRSGDVVLETRHGSIDASLGVRLQRVLARQAT